MNEEKSTEVSISAELNQTGIRASVMSRALSAWDRYWGSTADRRRSPIDAEISETNAIANARVKMIEALGDLSVDRLKNDASFAARAVDAFLPSLLRKQENKDAVLDLALQDLRQHPGTEDEAASGAAKLDDQFLNRFERYAEDATDEHLRERWAKVLASEIRRPGTFSSKVLRSIDELEVETAKRFEEFCHHLISGTIPKALTSEWKYLEVARFADAGLLFELGMGQVRKANELTDDEDTKLWMWPFGEFGIAVVETENIPYVEGIVQRDAARVMSLPVYILTDVGLAISSIMPSNIEENVDRLFDALSGAMPGVEIRKYAYSDGESHWVLLDVVGASQSNNDSEVAT